jgi:hypothetical protein
MAGVNDSADKVLGPGDASALENFARAKGVPGSPAGFPAATCATDGALTGARGGAPRSPCRFAPAFNALTGAAPNGARASGVVGWGTALLS